jgi:carbamoyl-phosphate synthase large subunit
MTVRRREAVPPVLITAVSGGSVGEQLVKSLRLAERPYRIIGTDTQAESLGLKEVDEAVLVPRASVPTYIETVFDLCRRFAIRAVFPGSDAELLVLSTARARFAAGGIWLFANRDRVLDICFDKARTAAFLTQHGFKPPRSLIVDTAGQLESVPFLPAVLKPNRAGGGSANVFIAQNESDLRFFGKYLLDNAGSCLVQEYVGRATDEYTVGVLSDLDGAFINSIAVRRNILPAFSNRSRTPNRTGNPALGSELVVSNGISQGHIGRFPEVTAVCERVAVALGSAGPLNIQCRFVENEVRVFEINPRFSGTTSLRALAGLNEPDLLFRRHVEGESLTPRFPYASGYIARGLREMFVGPQTTE